MDEGSSLTAVPEPGALGFMILSHLGMTPLIAADAFIAPTAVVIGDVDIGAGASLWFGTVVRGDVNRIRIGARTNIQDASVVHVTHEQHATEIGSSVTIGHMAVIHGCRLLDGSFVGMRACVMDGVVVEGRAMVAAGALVTPGRRVLSGQLWAGSPARHMRDLTEAELAEMARVNALYCELAAAYRQDARDRPLPGS